MAERKLNYIKSLAGIAGFLCIAVIVSACGSGSYSIAYTFDNQSSKTIYVVLSDEYSYKSGDEYVNSETNKLTVIFNTSERILIKSRSVDFTWTANPEIDNQNIQCIVNETTATFKDRQ